MPPYTSQPIGRAHEFGPHDYKSILQAFGVPTDDNDNMQNMTARINWRVDSHHPHRMKNLRILRRLTQYPDAMRVHPRGFIIGKRSGEFAGE